MIVFFFCVRLFIDVCLIYIAIDICGGFEAVKDENVDEFKLLGVRI